MKIQHLREYIQFSKYVNFTTAARKLYISQPTLSTHIASLEKELGVTLVKRSEPPSLTQAGRVFLKDATKLVKLHDEAINHCREIAQKQEQKIVIAMDALSATAVGQNFLIFRHKFLEAFPDTYIVTSECTESTASKVLAKGDADCVLVPHVELAEDKSKGIRFARIPNYSKGRLCLWVHKNHPLARKTSLTWKDLEGLQHPFVTKDSRVWSTAVRDLLTDHEITFYSRIVADEGTNFLYALDDQEVQLFDSGMNTGSIQLFSSRVFIPIEEDDAEVVCQIAYDEENNNPALKAMLKFLASCNKEQGV